MRKETSPNRTGQPQNDGNAANRNDLDQNSGEEGIVFRESIPTDAPRSSEANTEHGTVADFHGNRPVGKLILESLLDPKTLQILMGIGSTVLVIGLVIWLWSIGMFDHPIVGAIVLGAVNLSALGIGIFLTKWRTQQVAGKGLTFLACLVLPLNLWFYDAQGLIKIAEGGHLWVPALICTMIYTGVARWLKDKVFVYHVVGGVVLTGMLFLADNMVGRVGETVAPAILLTLVGTACLHARQLFPKTVGPFSRSEFGSAFFRSGQACLVAALATLGAGRIYHRMDLDFFGTVAWEGISFYWQIMPLIIIGIVIYDYVFSFLVTGEKQYMTGSGLLVIWAQFVLLDVFAIDLTLASTAILAAANSLGALTVSLATRGIPRTEDQEGRVRSPFGAASRHVGLFLWGTGVVLSAFAVLMADGLLQGQFTVLQIGMMLSTALNSYVASLLGSDPQAPSNFSPFQATQFHAANIYLVLATFAIGTTMTSPFEYAVVALGVLPWVLRRIGRSLFVGEELRIQICHGATMFAVIALGTSVGCWFFLEPGFSSVWISQAVLAATAFGLGMFFLTDRNQLENGLCASLSFNLFTWQLMGPFSLAPIHYACISAAIGFAGLLGSRTSQPKKKLSQLNETSFYVVIFSSIACLMIAGSRVIAGTADVSSTILTGAFGIALATSATISVETRKTGYSLLAGLHGIATMALLVSSGDFSTMQIVELISISIGLTLLGLGHSLWSRETDDNRDETTMALMIGNLLLCLPLIFGLIAIRFAPESSTALWRLGHEAGTLTAGLLLVGTGVFLRIRSTTLAGATTLAVYLVSLITLIHLPERLQSTSVYMMVGGGTFFAIAIVLSIFRDRLLLLPKKIENREGVFQVLKWR